jgi:hypothetical protein
VYPKEPQYERHPAHPADVKLGDDLIFHGAHIALRQYRTYGLRAMNEPEYRASTISWLREALKRLEAKNEEGQV